MATKQKVNMTEFSFLATRDRWSVDKDGEAKLTFTISDKEALKMAGISQYSHRLFQIVAVLLPPDTKPTEESPND